MVTTAGSPSGTAATARLMAMRNMSSQSSPPRTTPSMNTMATITRAMIASHLPSSAMRPWSGVFSSDTVCSIEAMLPSSVPIPVPVITAVPRP